MSVTVSSQWLTQQVEISKIKHTSTPAIIHNTASWLGSLLHVLSNDDYSPCFFYIYKWNIRGQFIAGPGKNTWHKNIKYMKQEIPFSAQYLNRNATND